MSKRHKFTLVLAGIFELTADLADHLFEATGGDIELSMRDGIVYLDFTRTGPSLHQAVVSAIKEVEQANLGLKVLRVESETANVIAKINADLLSLAP